MYLPNNNLDWALYWTSQQWELFPSYWKKTHSPLTSWGSPEGISSNPDIIKQWDKNWPDCYFCVAIEPSGLTLLDVDVKHDKNGFESLKTFELKHGALPSTLTVITPSGGRHYWFSGTSIHTLGKLGYGMDTPAMAPIPGTLVPGKGLYLIERF